ncbi:hypothetical protein HYV81_02630, partial [Candidatus Woesearchaeota archaeon]|nr:hypothetical protein [Candidatus Woesearchaeota archaeon]
MSNQLKSAIIDTEIVFDLCLTNLSSATASDYKCSITNLGLVEVQSGAYHDAFTSQDTPISISEMIDILKPEIIMIGYNNQYDFIKEIDNLNRQIDFKIVIKKCGSIENSLHKISKILPILIREGSHFVINHAGKGNIEMSGADFDFCNGCILEKDKKDYFILLDYMIYYFFNKYYPELVEPKIRSTYFLLFDMIHKTRNYELLTNIKLIFN